MTQAPGTKAWQIWRDRRGRIAPLRVLALAFLLVPAVFLIQAYASNGAPVRLWIAARTKQRRVLVALEPTFEFPIALPHARACERDSTLDGDRRQRLDAENRADQERLRALHAEKGRKPLLSLREARTRRTAIDWHEDDLAAPPFTGLRLVEEPVATLREYVDWSFFFHAWELKGRYPAILDDPEKGEVARDLLANANELLDAIAAEGSLWPHGVYGFWRAHAEGDDVVLEGGVRFPMLRQQADHADSRPNRSLADFVAPLETGLADHVGAFAVAIHGAEELAGRFTAELDDYRAIMVRALADRLAEAFAERLHEVARREWYAPGEELTNEERIAERFRGIRPAFGYPACPDHSEKRTLLTLLDAERAGIGLTESFATTPAASVSGLYFGHPQARYFSVGRIGRDQVADYAERKGVSVAEAERWLRQNLAYEPG